MKLQKSQRALRGMYGFIFILLVVIEVCIALFVHDRLVRPYIGDVLVVMAVYCFVRVFLPTGCRLLPLYVFLFAAGVEVLQYFELVRVLGLENHTFLKTLLGSVYDVKDILCYGAGCLILAGYELCRGKGKQGDVAE